MDFAATMYETWQANSAAPLVNGDRTIPVAVKSYSWGFSGTATNASPTTNNGTGWGLQATNILDSPSTNVDVTNEPTWSINATNNFEPPF